MNSSNLRKLEEIDERNLFRSALALLAIGICLFAYYYYLFVGSFMYAFSFPYILLGVLGLLGAKMKSECIISTYQISLIILMIFNSLIALAGIILICYLLLSNQTDCDSNEPDDTGLRGFICYGIYVLAILTIFIDSSIACLCYVFYGYASRVKNQLLRREYLAF